MKLFVFLLKVLFLLTIFFVAKSFTMLKSNKNASSNVEDNKQATNKNTANNSKQQFTQSKQLPKGLLSKTNNNNKDVASTVHKVIKKDSYQVELLKERDVLLKLQQQVSSNHNSTLNHPAMNALRTVLQRMHPDIKNNNISTSENAKIIDKVPKTSFSNKLRILFVAGLEGTGHHAMKSVLKECYTKGLCHSAGEATYDLFKHEEDGDHGLFGVLEGKYSGLLLERYYRHLSELKAQGEAMLQNSKNNNTGHLFIYGLEYQPGAGMLSYPNFNDKEHKVFNHADIIPMAILAESLGFDFRVLVLQRRSYEIFSSTMVKRVFGHGLEPKILLMNAAALYSQLSFLDPNFFRCVHYNELLSFSDQKLSQLASFLHPNIDLEMMTRMWQELRSSSNTTSSSIATSTALKSLVTTTTSVTTSSTHLRRALSSTEEAHSSSSSTSNSSSAVHRRTHDTTPESTEMHEILRGYEFYILRLAMELNRFDHICPAF